jgi:hypothetical protein
MADAAARLGANKCLSMVQWRCPSLSTPPTRPPAAAGEAGSQTDRVARCRPTVQQYSASGSLPHDGIPGLLRGLQERYYKLSARVKTARTNLPRRHRAQGWQQATCHTRVGTAALLVR